MDQLMSMAMVALLLAPRASAGCLITPDGSGNVVIPSSTTSIPDDAFYYCSSLKNLTFESGSQLETIGSWAFQGSGLTSFVVPASVTTLADSAFKDCSVMKSVGFERGSQLEIIGDSAFLYSGLTSIIIPASVVNIGYDAFYGCDLMSVTFATGSQLKSIANGAFGNLWNSDNGAGLRSIVIPATVTTIGSGAFSKNFGLANVTFESGSQLENIGGYGFYHAPITSFIVPASVTSIADAAFWHCSDLTSITFSCGDHLLIIDSNVFDETGLMSMALPSTTKYTGSVPTTQLACTDTPPASSKAAVDTERAAH